MSTTPDHHFISHRHGRDGIDTRFVCTAPDDAPCHQYANCDCETACEHTPVQQDECWAQPWMDDFCARECFDGKLGEAVRPMDSITVRFNGDCAEWEYTR